MSPEVDRRAPLQEGGSAPDDVSLAKACPSCQTRYAADALFCAFDGSPLVASHAAIAAIAATDPYIGHEIVGAIEIRQLVGLGAMGRVYRGFQKGIDRDVAVKILHRELSANPTLVARFHREAKVASRLAHPNVVHVLLTGQLPDGAMYIVMEYLDGMSLQGALAASGGAMPLPRALHVALGLCDAVGEAHAQGVVHRDLKPENVMLVRRADDIDFVKVLDFGIARLNWGDPSIATAAGLIFGTARYMSPEGAQGEKVGPPGDVYSIATIFYQMLAGQTPFEGEQAVALLVHQIHDPPPPLKSIARASYVPNAIVAAVMKNLGKKPEDRAENAREFGQALFEAAVASGLSAHEILARPGMSGGARGTHASVVRMSSIERTQQLQVEPKVAQPLEGSVAPTAYDAPDSESSGERAPVRTEIAEPPGDVEWRPVLPSPSGVDATMNEQPPPSTLPVSTRAPVRPAPPPSGRASTPVGDVSPPPRTSPASSQPTSSGRTRPGTGSLVEPVRGRTLMIVVACFLVGAIGMAGIASKTELGARHAPQLEATVARAGDALLHQRWDSPKGDNVRDITDDGLSRWLNDPQLLRIRTLACGDIVKAARNTRDEGNVAEALRLAKLAYQLDPSDELTQKLAAQLESQAQAPPLDWVPPLASAHTPAGAMAASVAARVTLDASNPKPGVGQPVDFSARVAGASSGARTKIDGASFRVSGPGIAAGTQLDTVEEGSGVFRMTFAFMQEGRFEVTFAARADGALVRAVRVVPVAQVMTAGQPKTSPPLPASSGELTPAPPSSAKWL